MNERERAIKEIGEILHRLIYGEGDVENRERDGRPDGYLVGVAQQAVGLAENWKRKGESFRRAEMGIDD